MCLLVIAAARAAIPVSIATLACAMPAAAQAQGRTADFDVPAQDLAAALQLFARQAHVQILFPYPLAAGRTSISVKGRLPVRDALERLIARHDLAIVRIDPERITLAAARAAQARASPPRRTTQAPALEPTPATPPPAPPLEDIIVTGRAVSSPIAQTSYSYAVTSLSADDLRDRGAVSTAELLRVVPGFWIESSGGEAGNNVRSRGIPTDGFTSIALAENGLPLQYDGGLGYLNTDQSFRFNETVERMEVVRGGPASLFMPNAPGGVANVIIRSALRNPGGLAKLSVGDNGYHRIDGYYGHRIAEHWGLLVGGFFRRDGGRRRPGYVADEGGQARVSLDYDDGDNRFSFDVRHLDDRVTFYLPVPLRYDAQGKVRPITGFDPLRDSLSGPETLRLPILTKGAPFDFDLSKGTTTRLTAATMRADIQLGTGLRLVSGLRLRTSDTQRNALFPTGAPMTIAAYLASINSAVLGAFPAATHATLNHASDGTPMQPGANGNGLVVGANLLSVHVPLDEAMIDSRVTYAFALAGQHDLAVGFTLARYSYRFDRYMGTVLLDVRDGARLIDVVARDAADIAVGRYTDHGFQRYGSIFDAVSMRTDALALYAADEWQIMPRLRMDFGARWEQSRIRGQAAAKHSVNLGDPLTMADDQVIAPTGETIPVVHDYDALGWSVGASYQMTTRLGLFARYTRSFRLPSASEFNTNPLRTDQATVPIRLMEVGLKYQSPHLSLFVTSFHTRFDRLPFTDFRFDTVRNDYVERTAIADTRTWGIELEARLRSAGPFELGVQGTWQTPRYRNFRFTTLVDGKPVERDYSSHQLVRVPGLALRIAPAVTLWDDRFRAELSFAHYSARWADIANSQRLPAYTLLGLDMHTRLSPTARLSLHLSNITNSIGLTEGNPRAGSFEAGSAPGDSFFARPEFARSIRTALAINF